MRKSHRVLFAMICAAAILAGLNGLSVFAAGEPDAFTETEPVVITCTEIPLYIDNTYIGSGIMMDSVTYVPLLTFTEYMLQGPCQVMWDQETETAFLSAEVLDITLKLNERYMIVNGRCIYFEDGVYNINGSIVVPIRELAKVFCLRVEWDKDAWAIRIDDGGKRILDPGEEFYDEGDLYWLTQVIFSEAGTQPMEGMIGVGNVVLNRVADESGEFEDTVFGVIFQPGQFDVVYSGAIYQSPSDAAVIAAKLCLEGYNTVGGSKWFLNPQIGVTGWIGHQLTLTASIADHDFYA